MSQWELLIGELGQVTRFRMDELDDVFDVLH